MFLMTNGDENMSRYHGEGCKVWRLLNYNIMDEHDVTDKWLVMTCQLAKQHQLVPQSRKCVSDRFLKKKNVFMKATENSPNHRSARGDQTSSSSAASAPLNPA